MKHRGKQSKRLTKKITLTDRGFFFISAVFALFFALTLSVSFSYLLFPEGIHALHEPTPREYLAINCAEEDCDLDLLNAIVFCESTWRMVKNRGSSAYGYFQIIDGTEATTPQFKEGLRKFDHYTNIDMGLYLYETRGSNPWNESRNCWQFEYWAEKNAAVNPECVGMGC